MEEAPTTALYTGADGFQAQVSGVCSILTIFQGLRNGNFFTDNRWILLAVSCHMYHHPSMFLCLGCLQIVGPRSCTLKSLNLVARQGLRRCSDRKVCLLGPTIAPQLEGLTCPGAFRVEEAMSMSSPCLPLACAPSRRVLYEGPWL